jgi:hypothetical protein
VPDELPVHVSREELHSLEVPESFEATDSFDLQLVNHGESVHLHIHLDDALSRVATVDAGNHHVERESRRYVRVDVDTDKLDEEPLYGKVKIASAYGANTRWIDIKVVEPEESEQTVAVDESLAQPQTTEPQETGPLVTPKLLVFGIGVLALLVALTAAVVIQQTIVLVGSLVVLGGVLVALFFLLAE